MSTDRDAYDLEKTPERVTMLGNVLQKRVYTWASTPLRKGVSPAEDERFPADLERAYRDLARAGLVSGEILTGKGHRAAVDWGLIKETPLHG